MIQEELDNLKCQSGISSHFESYGGRRTLPFVYTEQGVAMLTSALHTDRAIKASIQIMEAFVEMSHCIQKNSQFLSYQKLHIFSDRQDIIEADVKRIKSSMVTKSDLSEFI